MLRFRKFTCHLFCVLFALISAFSFASCKNDGFEVVQSITYTVEGETITETSQANLRPGDAYLTPSDKDTYNSVNENYRFDQLIPLHLELDTNEKTISNYAGLSESDIGETIGCIKYEYDDHLPTAVYYVFTFDGWGYSYLRVKVINHTIIVIGDGYSAGGTPLDRTYTVTSYQIRYFDKEK